MKTPHVVLLCGAAGAILEDTKTRVKQNLAQRINRSRILSREKTNFHKMCSSCSYFIAFS